jgi:outer membrane lipoprotein-sorting protein
MRYFLCAFLLLAPSTAFCRVGYAHLFNSCEAPPKGVDENLWKLMLQIDARGAKLTDLQADFTQEKFTPLLKKPLESTGVILIKGSAALWKTLQPSPTTMRIDSKEAKLYFPEQKVVEVYAVDQQMGALAASPFPRLEITKKYFTFERIPAKDLSPQADESKTLALRMTPIDPELRKHLDQVSVLLEIATGLVLRAETIDADGDRTVMKFSNIKTNSGLKDSDVELQLPPGVKITHPLEGVGGAPPPSREKGK